MAGGKVLSNLLTIERFWHFPIERERFFNMLADFALWPVAEKPRLLVNRAGERLVFRLDNFSRTTFEFTDLANGIIRVRVEIEVQRESPANSQGPVSADSVSSQSVLDSTIEYWKTVIESIKRRLNVESIVTVSAPGKINLFFGVGPLRANGYHDVVSVYQAVSIREMLRVQELPAGDEWSIETSGGVFANDLVYVPKNRSNLAWQAAEAIAAAAKVGDRPVEMWIDKSVPVSGGMGGGSADAAAALIAANQVWQANLTYAKLAKLAAKLGADVPFAINGGTAIGREAGDVLESLPELPELHWVLIPNSKGLSTPKVYLKLDDLRTRQGINPVRAPKPKVPEELLKALETGDPRLVAPLLHNDLQEAAIAMLPELQQTLDYGKEVRALRSIVSGSGPTVAMLALNKPDAERIAREMTQRGYLAITCFSPDSGARLES